MRRALLALLLVLPASVRAEKALQVAVLDLTPVGAPADVAVNLTAVVASEVGRYEGVRAITSREVGSLLGQERSKALAQGGACTDNGCMAQLADALGASTLLSGSVGLLEGRYVLTLQLLDSRTARVEARAVKLVPQGEGRLLDATKAAVTELMAGRASGRNQPPRLAVRQELVAHQGERVELDATRCYDPDGDPLTVGWRQVDGPPALLEGGNQAAAAFVAAEVGSYTFEVQVTDGRSAPEVTPVKVEVRPKRRFSAGLGFEGMASFNRLVEQDAAGHPFRNRAPYGPDLLFGLRLTEHWQLTARGSYSYLHTYPEDDALEAQEHLDVQTIGVLAGARYEQPFDLFALYTGYELGSNRVLYSAHQGSVDETNTRGQAILTRLVGGADIGLGEYLGLLVEGGLQAQIGTEEVAPFKEGISFRVVRGGFLWGFVGRVGVYARF